MKISAKQYGRVLFQLTRGKTEKEVGALMAKFAAFLIRQRQEKNLDKIIAEFGNYWNLEKGIVEAEITTAIDPDKETLKLLTGHIASLSRAKEVVLKPKVDKKILGGMIIKMEDKIFDGSLKTRLEELREKMIK